MNEKSRKTIASGQLDWAQESESESESETESKSLMKSQMEVQMMRPVGQMAQILTGSVPRALHKLAYIDALWHCRLRLHFALTVISGLFIHRLRCCCCSQWILIQILVGFVGPRTQLHVDREDVETRRRHRRCWKENFLPKKPNTHTITHTYAKRYTDSAVYRLFNSLFCPCKRNNNNKAATTAHSSGN